MENTLAVVVARQLLLQLECLILLLRYKTGSDLMPVLKDIQIIQFLLKQSLELP